jgi:tetratricopeptide (TPR) repeat protein
LLSPAAIRDRLDARLQLLTGGPRNAPARQQTLRATIAWSHDLLSPEEQVLFRRLAVFAGGFTLAAAEAVAHPSLDLGLDLLDGVGSLVDRSLLRAGAMDGEPRFTMLETVREFGLEQLEASGEARTVREGHATYLLSLARDAERRIDTPEQPAWLARLEREQDNLRAALAWARDTAESGDLGLRLAASLGPFWLLREVCSEGRLWLTAMLALPASAARTSTRARALFSLARLISWQGEPRAAVPVFEECIALAAELGRTRLAAHAEGLLASSLLIGCDLDAAHPHVEAAITLAREVSDPLAQAMALNGLGLMLTREKQYERALAAYEETLALPRPLGDTDALGGMLNNRGEVARYMGDLDRAAALYEESRAVYERSTGRVPSFTVTNLGRVALVRGDHDGARRRFVEGLEAARERGDRRSVAYSLLSFGQLSAGGGDPQRAARLLGTAAALLIELKIMEASIDQEGAANSAAAVRAQLGEAAFAAAWEAGRALSLDEAVALALEQTAGA